MELNPVSSSSGNFTFIDDNPLKELNNDIKGQQYTTMTTAYNVIIKKIPDLNVNIIKPKSVMFYQTIDGDMTINIQDISFMKLVTMAKNQKVTDNSYYALNLYKYSYTGNTYCTLSNKTINANSYIIISEDIDVSKIGYIKKEKVNYYESSNYLTEDEDAWIFDLTKTYFEIYMKGNNNGIKVSYRDGLQIQNIMQSEPYGLYKDDYSYLTSFQTNLSIPNTLLGKITNLSELEYSKGGDYSKFSYWSKYDTDNDLMLKDENNIYDLETFLTTFSTE